MSWQDYWSAWTDEIQETEERVERTWSKVALALLLAAALLRRRIVRRALALPVVPGGWIDTTNPRPIRAFRTAVRRETEDMARRLAVQFGGGSVAAPEAPPVMGPRRPRLPSRGITPEALAATVTGFDRAWERVVEIQRRAEEDERRAMEDAARARARALRAKDPQETLDIIRQALEESGQDAAVGLPAPGSRPHVRGITPAVVSAGGRGFVIRVSGSGFGPDLQILWNGKPLVTAWLGAGEVAAIVPPALLKEPGQARVSVGDSNVLTLSIAATAAQPGSRADREAEDLEEIGLDAVINIGRNLGYDLRRITETAVRLTGRFNRASDVVDYLNGTPDGRVTRASPQGGKEWRFNQNAMRLSTTAHIRALHRRRTVSEAQAEGIQHFRLDVPRSRLATLGTGGLLAAHLWQVRTLDEWHRIYAATNRRRVGASTFDTLGLHYGDFSYVTPVPAVFLRDAERQGRRLRKRWLAGAAVAAVMAAAEGEK